MSPNLNPVTTTLTVAGKSCHFVHLTLNQKFNTHHTFQIQLDYEELESVWMENPIKIIQLIGEPVNILMKHIQTGEENMFLGIITNVNMAGQHGEKNYIVVSGCSPSIKLEGEPMMNSFEDLTLDTIVQEVVGDYGNGAEVTVKPEYKGKIDYICQHDESVFQFINRLSWLYGEWFFYDGTTCYFGNPHLDDVTVITYDKEMTDINLSANLISPNVNRIEYLNHDNNEVDSDTPATVPGVRGYIKVALDQSEKVYTSDYIRRLDSNILTKKELDDMVKVDKSRRVAQMLTMNGSTQTCKIKIGKVVKVMLPENMRTPLKEVEKFIVTEITHDIDQDGTYKNNFSGIPSEIENIPMNPIKAPTALPQIAWVKTNADKKGRVKVQTQWQKTLNKTTNWIRVQTPDAGSSGKVASNRGFVFIPEEGDLIMLNFENGDPNKPYVTGSMFPENVSAGGGQTNKGKSMTTRTGSTVTLDDEKGSVYIADQTGKDSITIDGTNKISINTTKIIELNNGKSSITMTDDTIVISSANITIGGTKFVTLKSETAEVSVTAEGHVVKTTGKSNIVSSTEKTDVNGPEVEINSTESQVAIKGKKNINVDAPMVKINS